MLNSSSSKRSPAASRTQPIFSSVAAQVMLRGSARWPLQDPRRQADGVRLPSGQRQGPAATAADEERRMGPLDRLRLAVLSVIV